jgi:hypothetical protein
LGFFPNPRLSKVIAPGYQSPYQAVWDIAGMPPGFVAFQDHGYPVALVHVVARDNAFERLPQEVAVKRVAFQV